MTDSNRAAVDRPYRPIAVGFFLLAVPLALTAVVVAEETTGRLANGLPAVVFVLLGCSLWLRRAS